jgi:CBS domain-containing protein
LLANISYEGFTYAEYARRGFGELVVVAFLSLLLFLGLSSVTQRETPLFRKVYSGLGVLLGLLIGVILVSAFQRLLLYESAFGFTRLRIYPHIFMVWLGILLITFIGLEIAGRQRAFGLVLLAACVGFGLTLGLLNVDGLIARENVERAVKGKKLDTEYLHTLSVDSTPVLVDLYDSPDLSTELRDEVGMVLACQSAELRREAATQTWTGFHFSKWRARRMLENMEEALRDYPVKIRNEDLMVTFNGQEYSCEGSWWLD